MTGTACLSQMIGVGRAANKAGMGDVLFTRLVVAPVAAYAALLMIAVYVNTMTGKTLRYSLLAVTRAAGEDDKKSEEIEANVHLSIIWALRYAALTKLADWQ